MNEKLIKDTVLLGDWEEINAATGTKASTITKREGDDQILDGLVIKGYEMKWNQTNANGERYSPNAFDKFIKEYFVDKDLNMPVDINHQGERDYNAICGRVLYIEANSVGFYFVVYIPRKYSGYEDLKWRLEEGLIQGFSKEGYATDYEYVYNLVGEVEYELIKEMKLVSISLVTTPANGVAFEKMQEIKNTLTFENKVINNNLTDIFDEIKD